MTDIKIHSQIPSQLKLASVPSINPTKRKQIGNISEEFESVFLNLVFKSMRDSVHSGGLVDGGNAEEIYRSMLDSEYSRQMATQRQTGLANAIEKFIIGALPKDAQGSQTLQDSLKKVTIDNE